MGKDLISVRTGDRDQRDAGLVGGFDCERGRCRDRDEDRRTDPRGLLHHLNRHAARQKDRAARTSRVFPHQRTGKLVEGIVTADILPHQTDALVRLPKGCGMHAPRLLIEPLQRRERAHGVQQVACTKGRRA